MLWGGCLTSYVDRGYLQSKTPKVGISKMSRVVEQSRLSLALREAEAFILLVKTAKPPAAL